MSYIIACPIGNGVALERDYEPPPPPTFEEFRVAQERERWRWFWSAVRHGFVWNICFYLHLRIADRAGFFGPGKGRWCWPWRWHQRYYAARFGPRQ